MNVSKVIKSKGFTIQQVAEQMGVTRVTLSQTLSRNPTVNTLRKIAEVIGCEMTDFFLDECKCNGGAMAVQSGTASSCICPHCGGAISVTLAKE